MAKGPSFEAGCVLLDGEVVYRPQPRQLEFHTCASPYICYGGARGGAKTLSAIWESIITCLTVPGSDSILLRRTYPQLHKTILNEFGKIPYQVYSQNPKAFNRSKNVVNFDNGSHLWFGSCRSEEDIRQYLSAQYVFIGFDEASEFHYSQWEAMKGCNRCPIKTDINGNPVITKMCAFTNPGGVGHQWIKALFLDGVPAPGQDQSTYVRSDYTFIKSLVYDNFVYANDEAYMAKLNSLNPILRAMYRDGDWSQFQGQMFSNFSAARTVIGEDESLLLRSATPWQPHWISLDWGFSHYASASWATNVERFNPNGTKRPHILKYRELVTTGLGEAALAQEICRLNRGQKIERFYLSPDCFGDGNSRAKVIGDVMVQNGLPRPTPASNSREEGWRYLYELFGGDGDYSELLISEECFETIEAIPLGIRNVPNRPDDLKKVDAKSDDVLDDLRYLTYSRRMPHGTPKEVALAAAIQPFIEARNFTQAHIQRLKFEAEQKNKHSAKYIGRKKKRGR